MSNQKNENAELAAMADELGSEAAALVETLTDPEAAASTGYTLKLHRPVQYDGQDITELHFDFDRLTGQDSIEVLRVLRLKGISVAYQTVSEEFMRPMAARACTDKLSDGRAIGADIFDRMAVRDVNRVISRLRRFL